VSNDASGSRLPSSLGLRYSGGDADTWTTHCYEFMQVSVIPMHLEDIGRETGGTFARHRSQMAMCQSDFRSAVLHGVVTEQQYDLFRYAQVTSTT